MGSGTQRRGAAAARRPHKPEVAGSSPAGATTFFSGESARHLPRETFCAAFGAGLLSLLIIVALYTLAAFAVID